MMNNNRFTQDFYQPQPQTKQIDRINLIDVKARFFSALIFGALIFLVLIIASFAFGWHWLIAVGGGLVTFGFMFYTEITDAKSYQAPKQLAQQLPQQTTPQAVTITAEVKKENKIQMITFQADPEAVGKFARKVTKFHAGFSEKTAQKCGVHQEQFNLMRDEFIKSGWAEWKNPLNRKLGVVLKDDGIAWLEKAGGVE